MTGKTVYVVALPALVCLASFAIKGTLSLTLNDIDVPAHRVVGDNAVLKCIFDMEGDSLYSVKWYKDDQEFYRFVPNDRPKLQVFRQRGIHVDKSRSTKQQVVLTNLSLDTAGTYKCEVSAEAPSFRTKSAEQDMVVVVLPKKAEIVGAQPKYQVGDHVNVTCYSYRSRPAASLTWRVNGMEVSPRYEAFGDFGAHGSTNRDYNGDGGNSGGGVGHASNGRRKLYPMLDAELIEYKPQVEEVASSRLETSALGLSFRVRSLHVGVGLKLECTASIGSVYWQSFQEKIPVSPREQATISGNWFTSSKASNCFQNHGHILVILTGLAILSEVMS